MTTSQASRVYHIPYNSLLMYVRGKYGKSLQLDQLKKNTPAANDTLNTVGNSRRTPKDKPEGGGKAPRGRKSRGSAKDKNTDTLSYQSPSPTTAHEMAAAVAFYKVQADRQLRLGGPTGSGAAFTGLAAAAIGSPASSAAGAGPSAAAGSAAALNGAGFHHLMTDSMQRQNHMARSGIETAPGPTPNHVDMTQMAAAFFARNAADQMANMDRGSASGSPFDAASMSAGSPNNSEQLGVGLEPHQVAQNQMMLERMMSQFHVANGSADVEQEEGRRMEGELEEDVSVTNETSANEAMEDSPALLSLESGISVNGDETPEQTSATPESDQASSAAAPKGLPLSPPESDPERANEERRTPKEDKN